MEYPGGRKEEQKEVKKKKVKELRQIIKTQLAKKLPDLAEAPTVSCSE